MIAGKRRSTTSGANWAPKPWSITGKHHYWDLYEGPAADFIEILLVFSWCFRLGSGVAQNVVKAGLRCIVSNQDKWYLDHLDATWQGFYSNEPLTNITNHKEQALVLGGEVCAWAEHIDGSDIEATVWPRAAAAAGNIPSSDRISYSTLSEPYLFLESVAAMCMLRIKIYARLRKYSKQEHEIGHSWSSYFIL